MFSLSIDEAVDERLHSELVSRLEEQLARMVEAAWQSEKTERELEADFRIVNDDAIHRLNHEYRGKDSPTDVLAFAQREGEGGDLCPEILGDVIVSLDTAERQAKQDVHSEILFLFAHGLCHLLGYDHQDDEEESAMNGRMKQLLEESERSGPVRPA